MSDINRIKDKLAKLLRLGENTAASQGEIDNALTMAAAMMAKHNLTRDDIDLSEADPIARIAYGRHFAFSRGSRLTTWESGLAHFVTEFIGTVSHYSTSPMPVRRNGIAESDGNGQPRMACGVAFFGCDEDAACAVAMFEELRDAISMMAIIRWGGWARGDGAAYAEGFASGLSDSNKRAKETLMHSDQQTHALMLVSEKHQLAIRDRSLDWLKKTTGIKLKTVRRAGSNGSDNARSEGRSDGSNYDVNRRGAAARIA